MNLMSVFFPEQAGRLANLERRVAALEAAAGVNDVFAEPELNPVIEEIRAGRDIKAIQLYQQANECTMTEARVAVGDLKERIGY